MSTRWPPFTRPITRTQVLPRFLCRLDEPAATADLCVLLSFDGRCPRCSLPHSVAPEAARGDWLREVLAELASVVVARYGAEEEVWKSVSPPKRSRDKKKFRTLYESSILVQWTIRFSYDLVKPHSLGSITPTSSPASSPANSPRKIPLAASNNASFDVWRRKAEERRLEEFVRSRMEEERAAVERERNRRLQNQRWWRQFLSAQASQWQTKTPLLGRPSWEADQHEGRVLRDSPEVHRAPSPLICPPLAPPQPLLSEFGGLDDRRGSGEPLVGEPIARSTPELATTADSGSRRPLSPVVTTSASPEVDDDVQDVKEKEDEMVSSVDQLQPTVEDQAKVVDEEVDLDPDLSYASVESLLSYWLHTLSRLLRAPLTTLVFWLLALQLASSVVLDY